MAYTEIGPARILFQPTVGDIQAVIKIEPIEGKLAFCLSDWDDLVAWISSQIASNGWEAPAPQSLMVDEYPLPEISTEGLYTYSPSESLSEEESAS